MRIAEVILPYDPKAPTMKQEANKHFKECGTTAKKAVEYGDSLPIPGAGTALGLGSLLYSGPRAFVKGSVDLAKHVTDGTFKKRETSQERARRSE
jgi:hypothetical protein